MSKVSRPKIQVHSWGGFGSQIFACIAARRISQLFPMRGVVLHFHTSGVTRRLLELPKQFTYPFSVEILDDFRAGIKSETSYRRINPLFLFRRFLAFLLVNLGFITRVNNELDFTRIKPWLLQVRGHYTQLSLTKAEIEWLVGKLVKDEHSGQSKTQDELVLHLRLGDLMTLKNKSFIDPGRLTRILRENSNSKELIVYTDGSEDDAMSVIGSIAQEMRISVRNNTTTDTIRECLECSIFVGTNSKISLWIAVLRTQIHTAKKTYIPKEISSQFNTLMKDFSKNSSLLVY